MAEKTVGKSKKDKDVKEVNTENKLQSTSTIDIQKLIEESVSKALIEQSKKYQEEISILKKQFQEETKTLINIETEIKDDDNEFVLIPDNTKIEIRTNLAGKTLLVENRGKTNVFIAMNGYGETARLSYDELCALMGKSNYTFKSGSVAITGIFSDNNKITLKKLIEDRNLVDTYLNKDKISPINVEDLFNDKKVSEREFEKLVNNTPDLADTILEVAYVLYRRGLFNNNSKMNYLRQIFKKPNLFK